MKVKTMLMLCGVMLLSACSSVQYGDAKATETTTADFGSTDLQVTAEQMVDSLLAFPPIIKITQDRRPVIFVDTIKNKTTEHIDTESVTDSISTHLLKSGKFRFVDMTKVEDVKAQMAYQTRSGLVDQDTAVSIGKQIGAEYMLYGNLSSIVKTDGSTKDVYYKFTMKLMRLESGLLEWQDEQEIRKVKKRRLLGG